MSTLAVPALWSTAAVPLVAALWCWAAPSRQHAHIRGLLALALCAVLAAGVLGTVVLHSSPQAVADPLLHTGTHALLAVDIEGAIVALLAAVVGLAVLAAMPRRTLSQASIVRVMRTTGLSLLMFYAGDLVLLAVAWSAVAFPLRWNRKALPVEDAAALWRARMNLGVLGIVPLGAALTLWGNAVEWQAGMFDLFNLGVQRLPPTTEATVVGLVVLASASRMGLAPLHGWFPALMRCGMAPYAMTLLAPLGGAFVLLRVAPALAGGFLTELPALEVLGLASAAYLGLVAWGQREHMRYTEYLMLSQASIVFVALCTTDATTIEGGLTMWVAQGLASTGLVLAVAATHSRMGRLDLQEFHGIGVAAPKLTTLTFLFGIAVVGIPGTLTFVAEDIIAQGLLIPHPWLAAGFMFVTAINAIGFFRAFVHVHFGRAPQDVRCPDLRPLERVTMLALAAAVVLTGVVPQIVIGAEWSVAEHVVDLERRDRKPLTDPAPPHSARKQILR